MALIVPAVLPTSHKELEKKLDVFAHIHEVKRIQIDVVDGPFFTPGSWPYELQQLRAEIGMLPNLERIVYEIDLMCSDSESTVGLWLALGATRITFHAESITDLPRLFSTMRSHYGESGFLPGLLSFGLAISIATDLSLIEPHLNMVDYVQFMGIARIGRQGEPFDVRVLEKVRVFRARHPDFPIQVDGGVSLDNAKKLMALGVNDLVVGHLFMNAANPAAVLEEFEALQNPYAN